MKAMIYGTKHFPQGAMHARLAVYILYVLALLAMSARTAGARQRAEIIPLPFDSIPMQINNRGQIAGVAFRKDRECLFLYYNHSVTIAPIQVFSGIDALIATGVSINSQGTIAASILKKNGYTAQACIWKNGKILLLKIIDPSIGGSYAVSINDKGDVLGDLNNYQVSHYMPFVWSSGNVTYLKDAHSISNGEVFAVNNHDEVIGVVDHQGKDGHYSVPAAWIHGRVTEIGLPKGSTDATPLALNNHGLIVGYGLFPSSAKAAKKSGVYRRFLPCIWGAHGAQVLPSPKWSGCNMATAVNNFGEIVGVASPIGSDTERAILWEESKMVNLNGLLPAGSHWTLLAAYSINDRGDIVGTGLYRGKTRGYLLHIPHKLGKERIER